MKLNPSAWLAQFANAEYIFNENHGYSFSYSRIPISIIIFQHRRGPEYSHWVQTFIPGETNPTIIGKCYYNFESISYTAIAASTRYPFGDFSSSDDRRPGFKTFQDAARWIVERSLDRGILREVFNKRYTPLEQLADLDSINT